MNSEQSTPPPLSIPSTPPPVRCSSVPRITRNDFISRDSMNNRPMRRLSRNALFSPTRLSLHFPMNNPEYESPPRIQSVHQVLSRPHIPAIFAILTPDNPEYWRVNWSVFLKNPIEFTEAINFAPLEYQDDINNILNEIRSGANQVQSRRI